MVKVLSLAVFIPRTHTMEERTSSYMLSSRLPWQPSSQERGAGGHTTCIRVTPSDLGNEAGAGFLSAWMGETQK